MFGNKRNSIIGCYDRLVDIEPESHSQWLDSISDVEGRIEVGIAGIPTPTTMEKSCCPDSDISASATGLACVGGVYLGNNNTLLHGFVFHEGLQLCESPAMQLPIESSAFISADIFYAFHSENIAIFESFNNLLTYLMIFAPHKPSPSARETFEMPLGRLRALALQGSNKPPMLPHLWNDTAVKLAIRRNSKVLYSDINAQNTPMSSRAKRHVDVSGIAQAQKELSFSTLEKDTVTEFPSRISFNSIFWNNDIKSFPSANCRQTEQVVTKPKTSWRIQTQKTSVHKRSALSSLNHTTSLFNASTGKLGRQSDVTKLSINKWLKFNIVFDSMLPSGIDANLKSSLVNIKSSSDMSIFRNFDVNYYPTQHDSSLNKNYKKPIIHPTSKESGLPYRHEM